MARENVQEKDLDKKSISYTEKMTQINMDFSRSCITRQRKHQLIYFFFYLKAECKIFHLEKFIGLEKVAFTAIYSSDTVFPKNDKFGNSQKSTNLSFHDMPFKEKYTQRIID